MDPKGPIGAGVPLAPAPAEGGALPSDAERPSDAGQGDRSSAAEGDAFHVGPSPTAPRGDPVQGLAGSAAGFAGSADAAIAPLFTTTPPKKRALQDAWLAAFARRAVAAIRGDGEERALLERLAGSDAALSGAAREVLASEAELRNIGEAADAEEFGVLSLRLFHRALLRVGDMLQAGTVAETSAISRAMMWGPRQVLLALFEGRWPKSERLPGGDRVASGVHHDILGNMWGVVGYAEGFEEESREDLREAVGRYLEPYQPLATHSSRDHRLGEIYAEDIHTLAMERLPRRVSARSLALLVREAILPAAIMAALERIMVEVRVPPDILLREGFAVHPLELSLSELAFNAVKYADPARAIRIVRIFWDDAAGAIVVEDNGKGIADPARAFEEGHREAERHPGVKGTGMGLALVRRRIEGLSGRVELASKVGEGSTFRIILKEGDVVRPAPPPPAPPPRRSEEEIAADAAAESIAAPLLALEGLPKGGQELVELSAALGKIAVRSLQGDRAAGKALVNMAVAEKAISPAAQDIISSMRDVLRPLMNAAAPEAFEREVRRHFDSALRSLAWQAVLEDPGRPTPQESALRFFLGKFSAMRWLFDARFPETPQDGASYQLAVDALHDLLMPSGAPAKLFVSLAVHHADRGDGAAGDFRMQLWAMVSAFPSSLGHIAFAFPEMPALLHGWKGAPFVEARFALAALLREALASGGGGEGWKARLAWQGDPQAIVVEPAAAGAAAGPRAALARRLLEPAGWRLDVEPAGDSAIRFVVRPRPGDIAEIGNIFSQETGSGLFAVPDSAKLGHNDLLRYLRELAAVAVAAADGHAGAMRFLEELSRSTTSAFSDAAGSILRHREWMSLFARETDVAAMQREFAPFMQSNLREVLALALQGNEGAARARRMAFALSAGPLEALMFLLQRGIDGRDAAAVKGFRHDEVSGWRSTLLLHANASSASLLTRLSQWAGFDPATLLVGRHLVHALEGEREAALRKKVEFEIDVPPGLAFRRGVDAASAREVVAELVRNAVKYHRSEGEGRFIRVRWDGARRAIVVEDNGTGIADTERVWEEGHREAERHPGVEGTGTGLWSVRRRIADLGWAIALESRVGEGARFIITPKAGDVIGGGPPRGSGGDADPGEKPEGGAPADRGAASAGAKDAASAAPALSGNSGLPPEAVALEGRARGLLREVEAEGRLAYSRIKGQALTAALYDEALEPLLRRVRDARAEMARIRPPAEARGREEGWGPDVFEHIACLWHDVVGRMKGLAMYLEGWRNRAEGKATRVEFAPAVLLPRNQLASSVQEAAELSGADREGVVISVFWSQPELASFAVDRDQNDLLENLLDNLLTNAVKYANRALPAGARRVDISVSSEGGFVVFEVADNGRGMSPEALARYGKMGWRDPAVVAEGIAGTGIGASSVRRYVASLGGRVDVSSELGVGTTVRMSIPEKALALQKEAPAEEAKEMSQGAHGQIGGIVEEASPAEGDPAMADAVTDQSAAQMAPALVTGAGVFAGPTATSPLIAPIAGISPPPVLR